MEVIIAGNIRYVFCYLFFQISMVEVFYKIGGKITVVFYTQELFKA